MKKKRITTGLLFFMLVALLAGCGKKETDSPVTETEEKTVTGEVTEATTGEVTEAVTTTEEVPFLPVTDDSWSSLLKGNLNKSQLEFMLAMAAYSSSISGKTSGFDYSSVYSSFILQNGPEVTGLNSTHSDGEHTYYNLAEYNNLISVLTDDVAVGNDFDIISGDEIGLYSAATVSDDISAAITDSRYREGDTIYAEFTYHYSGGGGDLVEDTTNTALLSMKEDGKYQITELKSGALKENYPALFAGDEASGEEQTDGDYVSAYKAVLENPAAWLAGQGEGNTYTEFEYALVDMTGDNVPELYLYAFPDASSMTSWFFIGMKEKSASVLAKKGVNMQSFVLYNGKPAAFSYATTEDFVALAELSIENGEVVFGKEMYGGVSANCPEYDIITHEISDLSAFE